MPKAAGKALRTGAACAAFRTHLDHLREQNPRPSSWTSVQTDFLSSMMKFDDEVTAGRATEGERQNGKGDYFNDVLAVILENSSGVRLNKRKGVAGLIFPNHNLDVTYPQTGTIVEVLVEAKMMGTPLHPGNASSQKNKAGRPGSADMLKRCKEAGFKTIDLKAAYGMLQSAQGLQQQAGPAGDLTSWLRTAKPRSYLVAAVRVVNEQDANAVLAMANAMTQVMDGVGIFLYRPKAYSRLYLRPASYEAVSVPPHLELSRVLQRVTTDLSAAPSAIAETPGGTQLPSQAVQEALDEADVDDDDELTV